MKGKGDAEKGKEGRDEDKGKKTRERIKQDKRRARKGTCTTRKGQLRREEM